jgi:DNA-binding NtrC family response regulator
MKNYKILFVDDDQQILSIVEQFLSRSGFNITTESNGLRAIEKVRNNSYSVVFTDLIMPEISGMEILKQVKAASPETEVIIVSGYGTIESAIEAMKLGSYDFLQKPINFDRFKILINRIIEKQRLTEENQLIRSRLKEGYKFDELVGMSSKMKKIYSVIDKISFGSPTVLIEGESGTGKELTANVIHNNSDRKNGPFVPVNCGAIAESLLESELFGHVKGAFTGASKDSIGSLKPPMAEPFFGRDRGSLAMRSKSACFVYCRKKKSARSVILVKQKIDVRVIAATNKNLEAMPLRQSNLPGRPLLPP